MGLPEPPSYSGERSAAAIRIPNLRHALATSGHKPEKEFYTRRQYVVYEDQLQYEVATFSSTHEKKDYSNMKEQYTNKTGKAQHSGLNSLQASMWKNVRSQAYAWDKS